MHGSRLIKCLALVVGLFGSASNADSPRRVVSMNLCTDQLAMMLAGEGQLFSVSQLAFDPRSSVMLEEAKAYVMNHSRAEEIYLMHPDLVLAGSFTSPATVDMLERLGLTVVLFEPANSLDEVADRMIQMGGVLGQQERAVQMAEDYRAGLAALQNTTAEHPRAVLYSAGGYTSGNRTLAGQILTAAGFTNMAVEAGYANGGFMPLEVLAMAAPEVVITARPYAGASRAEDIMEHPVVQALRANNASGSFTDRDWVCDTPYVLRAIESLTRLRQKMRPQ